MIVGHRHRSWLSVAVSRLSVVEHRLMTVGVGFRLKFGFSVPSSDLKRSYRCCMLVMGNGYERTIHFFKC
jgi:hypothetical protein